MGRHRGSRQETSKVEHLVEDRDNEMRAHDDLFQLYGPCHARFTVAYDNVSTTARSAPAVAAWDLNDGRGWGERVMQEAPAGELVLVQDPATEGGAGTVAPGRRDVAHLNVVSGEALVRAAAEGHARHSRR